MLVAVFRWPLKLVEQVRESWSTSAAAVAGTNGRALVLMTLSGGSWHLYPTGGDYVSHRRQRSIRLQAGAGFIF